MEGKKKENEDRSYRRLEDEQKRILKMIWNRGKELEINEEIYREIISVKFTIPFFEPRHRSISHFETVDSWFKNEIPHLMKEFREEINTRRAYCFFPELVIGDPPCNLVYLFMIRGGFLNLLIFMRSFDVINKFFSDVNTAMYCLKILSSHLKIKPNIITFFISSAHIRKRDTLLEY